MKIAEFLREDLILPDLSATDKAGVLRELCIPLGRAHGLDPGRLTEVLLEREKLGSTGLGFGVAIPHGRIRTLKEPACAFVRTQAPIPFEAPDGQSVSLVFALLVPEHATEAHLEILSELAQMFSDPDLRDQLAKVHDIQAAHRLITEWSPYAPAERSAAV